MKQKPIDEVERLRFFVARHGTQRAAAGVLGISQAYLNDLLHGRRQIGSVLLDKLGLKRIVVGA